MRYLWDKKMNRTIKFRGFAEYENRWVFGDLKHGSNNTFFVNHKLVVPESVGQFTGLHDKNGNEIFEGDVFELPNNRCLSFVDYVEDMFHLKSLKYKNLSNGNHRLNYYAGTIEVIGNSFQNPELVTIND